MSAGEDEQDRFVVKGRIRADDVDLRDDVPLRVAAVRDQRVVASQVLGGNSILTMSLTFLCLTRAAST